jgi:glutamine synthetase
MSYTKEDIIHIVKEERLDVINLWFTDIEGILKGFAITPSELPAALEEGMGFDGSSISGFNAIEESDLVAMPDISTFQRFPWEDEGRRGVRMFCDILNPDKTPYDGDPRFILRRSLAKAKKLGYTCYAGPELEYFYLKDHDSTVALDHGGYFSVSPTDVAPALRKKTIDAVEKMGIQVEYHHHEVAPSQHEIDLKFQEADSMADTVITYRYLVKEVANQEGVYATFMPKPIFGVNGSGMHVHQSLFKDGHNAFFDANDPDYLSKTARSYTAGILKYAQEICAFLAQWVNSYKRLVPGFEAPVYISWSQRNRSALVRVPVYQPGKENHTRIELRCPDPACNPYIAFAMMIEAGLAGIEEKLDLEPPVQENLYHLTELERMERGIQNLPSNLHEALHFAKISDLTKRVLGERVLRQFLEIKYAQWDAYRIQVTPHEIAKYLPML